METLSAFAYLDPGSGMLLWQMLLSIAVGIWFVFKSVRDTFLRGIAWIASGFKSPGSAPRSPAEKN